MVNLVNVEQGYDQIAAKLSKHAVTSRRPTIQHAKDLLFETFSHSGVVHVSLLRIRRARKTGLLPNHLQFMYPDRLMIKADLIDPDTCGSTQEDIALLERCDTNFTLEKVVAEKRNMLGPFPIIVSRCDAEATKVPDNILRTTPLPTVDLKDEDKPVYQIFLRQLHHRFYKLP
jgi:hypothetical protein